MDNDASNTTQREERNIFLRILFAFLFFIPFYFVTSAIIGGVVGGTAGTHAGSFQEGEAAGGPAARNFFQKYGLIVFLFQILAYTALCLLRWVPGVGKYKKVKQTQ
jgi:nitrate reductase NapE component